MAAVPGKDGYTASLGVRAHTHTSAPVSAPAFTETVGSGILILAARNLRKLLTHSVTNFSAL